MLHIALDRRLVGSLQRQITEGIRAAIAGGRVPPGARLPGARSLARMLGVSRITVTAAFDRLIAEGTLAARPRAGVFVAAPPPRAPPSRPRATGSRLRLGRRAARLAAVAAPAPPRPVAFALSRPALDAFPITVWNRLLARRAARTTIAQLDYGLESAALREAIASLVSAGRGWPIAPDQVLVVAGSQRALELAALALLDPGDLAAVEDPGYPGARAAFGAAGATVVAAPIDEAGIDLRAWPGGGARSSPRISPRLVHVTPSCQFPTGVVMPLARRQELLAWARRHRAGIVEDDYDVEFSSGGAALPALAALDREGRVLYVGSFSRTLFPALRVGYLIAPTGLAARLRALHAARDEPLPALLQLTLADFITGGHYLHHVRRMGAIYRERRAVLVAAAAAAGLVLRPSSAGLHAICELPRGCRASHVVAAARDRGLEVASLDQFRAGGGGAPALVLGFAVATPRRLRAAVTSLAEVIAGRP